MRAALETISIEPLIAFEAAMKIVDRLEQIGLSVDPQVVEYIAELLDE